MEERENTEGDVFWPEGGYPVSDWKRKWTFRGVMTEDHGWVRCKRVYVRQVRLYRMPADGNLIVNQYVEDIDA